MSAIRLRAGVRSQRIFRYARRVSGSDGSQEPYDNLIIATGSHPFIPPLNGLTLPGGTLKPGIFGFRSLDDCRRIARTVFQVVCYAIRESRERILDFHQEDLRRRMPSLRIMGLVFPPEVRLVAALALDRGEVVFRTLLGRAGGFLRS